MGLRHLMGGPSPRRRVPCPRARRALPRTPSPGRCALLHAARHPEVAYRVAAHAPLAELGERLGGAAGARPGLEVGGLQAVVRGPAAQLAHAPQGGGHGVREGRRVKCAAVRVSVEGEGGGRLRRPRPRRPMPAGIPWRYAAGAALTATPASLLSMGSTMPYLRYFIM